MRHRKSFNHLGRTASHRKAMLANMASSLIMHKRITTTTAKAKALRTYVEPLITKSKDDTTHSRRVVFSHLQDKDAVSELFREVAAKVAERPGGYTRILKIGSRLGDSAEMAIIELVAYNELLLGESTQQASTRRRRRGSGSKGKTEGSQASSTASPAASNDVVADVEVIEEGQNLSEGNGPAGNEEADEAKEAGPGPVNNSAETENIAPGEEKPKESSDGESKTP